MLVVVKGIVTFSLAPCIMFVFDLTDFMFPSDTYHDELR
jgi:hypothetical protein